MTMLFLEMSDITDVPFDSNSNRTWNHVGMPVWFTRATLHRAIFTLEGPYTEPSGKFNVPEGYALVQFEVKQAPAGTPQALLHPRKQAYAILRINRDFVSSGSLMSHSVNPNAIFNAGDDAAIWFGTVHPAEIVGAFRKPPETSTRNSGSMMKNPQSY